MMNLSICDAAAELGVSETRLRKTLADGLFPTLQQVRPTRTGPRRTTLVPPETLAMLRSHFDAAQQKREEEPIVLPITEGSSGAVRLQPQLEQMNTPSKDADAVIPGAGAQPGTSVPAAQFHALLFQHNVLREELTRVTHYLDDCDRLLGEMVKTIAGLEQRTQQLEQTHVARRPPREALTGALRSVSSSLQNMLQARQPSSSGMLAPAEVYYANVLTGR